MGLDFTEKCAPSWTRGWDREKNQLEKKTLFTSVNDEVEQSFRAMPSDGKVFSSGTKVLLRIERDTIFVVDGTDTIGQSIKTSPALVEAITNQGGKVAVGVVGNVVARTGSAEIHITH